MGFVSLPAQAYSDGNAFELLSGTFQQGSLLVGRTDPGSVVLVDGRQVRVGNDGRFVFGFDRDAAATVDISITRPGQPEVNNRYPVATREYNVQRLYFRQGAGEASPELEARMQSEAAANRAARARDSDMPYAFEQFSWPATGRITGVFGSQRIINGEPRQPHYGLDIAGPVGEPVYAPADGVVSLANPGMLLSGGTLYVDHGQGVSSAFLHLSRINVVEGQTVRRGQKIAEIGRTGRVTGPHLDWRVNWFEARVDAAQLVPPMPQSIATSDEAEPVKASYKTLKTRRRR